MLAKITAKNQLTLPKSLVQAVGATDYFDVEARGGQLILTTPCTWLEDFTPPSNWPPNRTIDWITDSLSPHFRLLHQKDLPFLIREHSRKFQWSVALGSLWERL